MDWIEEKAEQFMTLVRNLSFRKAMMAYITVAAFIAGILAQITMTVCYRFESIIWNRYALDPEMQELPFAMPVWDIWAGWSMWVKSFEAFEGNDQLVMSILEIVRIWCPFFYMLAGCVAAILLFYKNRLKKPFHILRKGTLAIRQNNLDFPMQYDSRDELGQLSGSFEEMRLELILNKEEMWHLIDNQKKLNAAFAHDLRTPLTVLRGYSDFLARYVPKGKVSEEKMVDTLKLMSAHLERLEHYSRTMNGIRSIEEMPVNLEHTQFSRIKQELEEVIFALNQIGDIEILLKDADTDLEHKEIHADRNIVMEVLENLLSNAIRYAEHQIEVTAGFDKDTCMLILAVRDDGPGFGQEDLQKALLPYYREHAGDKEEHFGIGLHICSRLCEKHGGSLGIANSVKTGAIVTASFSCVCPIHNS